MGSAILECLGEAQCGMLSLIMMRNTVVKHGADCYVKRYQDTFLSGGHKMLTSYTTENKVNNMNWYKLKLGRVQRIDFLLKWVAAGRLIAAGAQGPLHICYGVDFWVRFSPKVYEVRCLSEV